MTSPVTEADEQQLCRAAAQGSSAAFASLVNRHQQGLRAFLRRLTANWAEADDLAQDVFVEAWLTFHRFDESQRLRPWLCGIAYRKFLASRRSFWRRLKRESIVLAEQDFIHDATSRDAWLDLRRAMQTLPVEQRAVVALCVASDWSHSEAASALGLPLGTVKSHVQRSRLVLGKYLVGYAPDYLPGNLQDCGEKKLGSGHE